MACKITVFYSSHKDGWSESFYHTGDDPGALLPALLVNPGGPLDNRMRLMGVGVVLDAVRISNVDKLRDGVLRELDWATADGHNRKVTPESQSFTDVSWTGVLIRIAKNPAKKGWIFARGLPDSLISGNPRQFVPTKAWSDRFDLWAQNMHVYSLRVRVNTGDATPHKVMIFARPQANGNVRITTEAPLVPGPNEPVFIGKGKYKTPGYKWPSGNYFIVPVAGVTNTYELSGTESAVPADLTKMADYVAGSAKAQVVRYEYPTIDFATIGQTVRRKAGRPFGGLVGRRPVRK